MGSNFLLFFPLAGLKLYLLLSEKNPLVMRRSFWKCALLHVIWRLTY